MHPPPAQTPLPPPLSPIFPRLDSLSLDDDNSWLDDVDMFDEIPSLNDMAFLMQPDDPSTAVNPAGTGALNDTATTSVFEVAPPAAFHGESSRQGGVLQPDVSGFGNPARLPVWPAPPILLGCGCSEVLREITHIKGNHLTKLEIHGTLGLISHAILEDRLLFGDWTNQSQCREMLDFSKKSIEAVKDYLVQYCEWRRKDGYTLQKDPLLTFYEALCAGMMINEEDHDSFDPDDFLLPCWESSGENQDNQPEPLNQTGATRDEIRLSLAEQRERTKNMTIKDFVGYFRLPIEVAAKELNVCPTVVKKVCRKHGLERWPHRKIKSIEKKISDRRQIMDGNINVEERVRAQGEIESLEKELASLYQDIAEAEMSSMPLEYRKD